MKIEENTVVQFHYRLREEGNETEIETSFGDEPAAFLCGHDNIIKGLEKAMLGHEKGDTFTAAVTAKEAYGERVEDKQQRVPVKHLMEKKNAKLKVGQVVNIQTDSGAHPATILKVGKFNVDVDTNHPLAGKALSFDIEIIDVRAATEDEVTHKHAHGVGGHQHD
ncbi:MAG: peptidylprolyl isomerase [Pseudomonadales bacterium]|nr:peptidylprolyl isomerase [Pseudomonadales bacterium]